jgi:hypothetical protein
MGSRLIGSFGYNDIQGMFGINANVLVGLWYQSDNGISLSRSQSDPIKRCTILVFMFQNPIATLHSSNMRNYLKI